MKVSGNREEEKRSHIDNEKDCEEITTNNNTTYSNNNTT